MDSPVYLIFGGSGGIGAETARQLAATGAQPVVAARNRERLEATGFAFEIADATLPEQVQTAVDACLSRYGRVDGVVNCAGSILLKPAHQVTDQEWRNTVETNLYTSFFAVRSGVRAMMKSGGSIVLVSTAAAVTGLPNHDAISAAKAGVIGLTLSSAASYARYGIRVNCVAPGLVRTPLSARITGNEAALKASEGMHPLGRIGEPAEVASAIVWLLGQRWVTGQVLGVDGGLAALRTR